MAWRLHQKKNLIDPNRFGNSNVEVMDNLTLTT